MVDNINTRKENQMTNDDLIATIKTQNNALKEARRAIAEVLELTTSDKEQVSVARIRDILCNPYIIVCVTISQVDK